VKPGILVGTPQQVIDRVGEYARAGVEQLNVALRAPFDVEGLERFVDAVMPAFA
jgi:alkanesulfonate monooxygenase SsuD/methylene tetrahydromethanopterin reductase-like flavin-dependent oxidoreductase (luciferase family)